MVELNNGIKVPLQGLGASAIYGSESDNEVKRMCERQYNIYCYALKSGKCHLYDTSGAYGHNEKIFGAAYKETGVKREDIFLISKVSNRQQDEKNVRKALENSLKAMNVDYLDLYLIHWPKTGIYVDTYKQMEKLIDEGLVKGIGVCNCQKHHLEELEMQTSIVPAVNQIEIHPLFTQDALVNYCIFKGIQTIAYTPVARMHDILIKSKPIHDLAIKYKKTEAQIVLRWHYQLRRPAIPRTLNEKHFDDIFSIDTFDLEEKEVCWINSLNENIRLRYNPDTCDFSRN